MRVNLKLIKDPIWAAKFFCPIDRKWVFVKQNDTEAHFGICNAQMSDFTVISAAIDWVNLIVVARNY